MQASGTISLEQIYNQYAADGGPAYLEMTSYRGLSVGNTTNGSFTLPSPTISLKSFYSTGPQPWSSNQFTSNGGK